jgi:hypothetical protein
LKKYISDVNSDEGSRSSLGGALIANRVINFAIDKGIDEQSILEE